jgi:hypothetical protein
MNTSVDRIEGDRAVLDIGGEKVEIPAGALPEGAQEGSWLKISLADASEARAAEEERLARLRKKSPPKMSFDL